MGFLNRLLTAFGYDAVESTGKRKRAADRLQSEDAELPPSQRRKLQAETRDINRNFALAAWMIRRHLDYVATFSFQAKTQNKALDLACERFVTRWSRPDNFDVAGRNGLPESTRITEARRTIDGDCGIVKLASGQVQGLEGDRIRTPTEPVPGINASELVHGVQIDKAGKALAYAICNRGASQSTFRFERMVPASSLYLHAGFERFDQIRGVTPLSTALNTLRDTYEGFEYALAKLKVAQLFGLSIFRQGNEQLGINTPYDDDADLTNYSVDLGKGPFLLQLDPGDRAEFLEARTPSTETVQFLNVLIAVALKSLDIPYSFYAENFTNYSGARQALLQYEQSAAIKRTSVKRMLDHLTTWRFILAVQDGELPREVLDLILSESQAWDWIPQGLPWIDPVKESTAENLSILNGTDNPEDIAQRHGRNFFTNIDKTAACLEYAGSKGVKLNFGGATLEQGADDEGDSGDEAGKVSGDRGERNREPGFSLACGA